MPSALSASFGRVTVDHGTDVLMGGTYLTSNGTSVDCEPDGAIFAADSS